MTSKSSVSRAFAMVTVARLLLAAVPFASCGGAASPSSHAPGTAGQGAGAAGSSGGQGGGVAGGGAPPTTGAGGGSGDSSQAAGHDGGSPDGGASDGDSAAGDGPGRDADASARGRLVPWQIQAEGTPPLVVGVYDTQEQAHCRFLHDQSGQLRCLPWATATLTETTLFSDSSCQAHVYRTDSLQGRIVPGRPVAAPLPRVDCEPRRYQVASLRVLAPTAQLFGGTPCAPLDPARTAAPGVYVNLAVDSVIAPERWAPATEVDGPSLSDRLRIRQVETADGTRFGDHLVDQTFGGRSCELQAPADASGAGPDCVPTLLSQTGSETADCSAGKTAWRAAACSDPAAIGVVGSVLYAIGPKWTGPVTMQLHGCQSLSGRSTPDGPDEFYERGAVLYNTAIASATWQSAGSARFTMTGLRGASGEMVPIDDEIAPPNGWIVPRYFDSQAKTDCEPRWTPEGVRCIPTSVIIGASNYSIFFADAACKEPALQCLRTDGACGGVPVISSALDANGETRITALNAAVVVTSLFQSATGGDCVASPVATSGGASFFKLGAALPWSAYPQLTEMNGRASGAP